MATGNWAEWSLTTVESVRAYRNFTVTGQFPVVDDGITWSLNSTVAELGAHGQSHPLIQWIRGELETITLPVMFFSRHSDDDIEQRFKSLKKLRDWDRLLRRAPVCRFTFGSILGTLCIVRGLGDVKIYRLRTDGMARRIELTVTMSKYVPYKLIKSTDKPKRDTLHHKVGRLDRSWEMLAIRAYGPEFALWGDRLRKRNRDQAFAPIIGTTVDIPAKEKILAERILPEYHGFNRQDEAAQEVVLGKFQARNALFRVKQRV